MYYSFQKNVYLVKGEKRGCIYDLNNSKLYSINHELTEKLDLVNQGNLCTDITDKSLIQMLEKLENLNIIRILVKPESHYLGEIKAADNGCSFAWIEITNKCNLRCIHCYNESDANRNAIMSLDNYKLAIDSLLKLGVRKIQIIGGEPFVYKQLLRSMLDYAIGKFAQIEVFTNGTLVTDEWFEYLKKNKIKIALSVYSYEKEMHDKVTGCNGSWEKTNNTISKLRNSNIDYRVCNVLMKDIVLGEPQNDLYRLSTEKDVVRMSGRANFALLSDELISKKLITKKSFQNAINKNLCSLLIEGHNCFMSKIYISANLEVFPCVMERRFKHCIINKKDGIKLDDSIRYFSKDNVKECRNCEYRYTCFDCRPNSLSGDIQEKPWYCTYDPLTGEWSEEKRFISELKSRWSKK